MRTNGSSVVEGVAALLACTGKPTVSKRRAHCQATWMLGSRDARMTRMRWAFIVLAVAAPARAPVDPARADTSFKEAAALCAKMAGGWGARPPAGPACS